MNTNDILYFSIMLNLFFVFWLLTYRSDNKFLRERQKEHIKMIMDIQDYFLKRR